MNTNTKNSSHIHTMESTPLQQNLSTAVRFSNRGGDGIVGSLGKETKVIMEKSLCNKSDSTSVTSQFV